MHLPPESLERIVSTETPAHLRPVIFVVEDEEDIARLISHNLQAAGFSVNSFFSGASVVTGTDASCLMHVGGGLSRAGVGVRTLHLAEILAGEAVSG